MSTHAIGRQAELRSLITDFLSERLNAKLEKLIEDDPKRFELRTQFVPATWLEDAARRVDQIQAVTHSLKPIHPDAKGSSLFRQPSTMVPVAEVGSHVLGAVFDADVVGNAAALDVYKLLKLEHQGRSLLSLAVDGDADLGAALSPEPAVAKAWMQAFAGLAAPRAKFSSHTQAKQIYWPVGGNSRHDDSCYHLLAPLYPTSLVHRVYQTVQDDRFGDSAKAAREASKAEQWHERPLREYRRLAIQKLGGTKPQNISQLNSERGGTNFLLASLPPVWQSTAIKPVLNVESMFDVFRWRPEARNLVAQLRRFLGTYPEKNAQTRATRDAWVEELLDDLMQFSAEVRALPPGWSLDSHCKLPSHHMAWLDPDSTGTAPSEATDRMASDFAHWLNARLSDPLPMGSPEYLHWRKQARDLFKQAEREGAYE